MKKVYILTNIPTPYRNHFFNCLKIVGKESEIYCKVFYMAKTEKGRYWDHTKWDVFYDYEFMKNYGLTFKNIFFHFNPSIVTKLMNEKPEYLIIAGSWNFPTVMLTILCRFLYPKTKLGFWNEGNLVYETYSGKGLVRRLKKEFYNRFHFLISSGMKSDELIRFYVKNAKIVRLVNVIEEANFSITPKDFESRNYTLPYRLFIASKLNERKNVFFFAKSIETLFRKGEIILRIAGEGEEKEKIQEWVKEQKLDSEVKLLGQIASESVYEELKDCDIFCMPSRREPFPLSLIEALFMYKPLLVSSHVGSLPEIMNENGLIFDPLDKEDIKEKVKSVCGFNEEKLKQMGYQSRAKAETTFQSEKVTIKFLEDLLSI